MVAAGTYTWSGEGTGDSLGLIRMKSGIVLRSETGEADCVTIDAEGQGRVLYGENLANTTRIEGFTTTGGSTDGLPWDYGGGMALPLYPSQRW